MDPVVEATLVEARGIVGNADQGLRRQVTLLESEAWQACMAELGVERDPSLRRANILLSGVSLAHTRGRVLAIGDTQLLIGGEVTPCKRMEEAVPGLQTALRPDWRGGVFAQVLAGGMIRIGDGVEWKNMEEHQPPLPHVRTASAQATPNWLGRLISSLSAMVGR